MTKDRRRTKAPKEVSSRRERRREESTQVLDPRFISSYFNPIRHTENYHFLYTKEKEQLQSLTEKAPEKLSDPAVKSKKSRIEARERILKLSLIEKQRREEEIDTVKQGKKPFYLSAKTKKIIQRIETAKEKGVDHVLKQIRKKEREKENRSREVGGK